MVGLANPYALAELAVGRKVRWASVTDREAFVERVLGAPIAELCAPVAGNLLVNGAADVQEAFADIRDATTARSRNERFKSHADERSAGSMLAKLSPAAQDRVISALAGGGKTTATGFTPEGAEWADPGDFFEEAAEYFDPVQGTLADCYFIAALSAVSWSRPYVILQRGRATGPDQSEFVNRIDFFSAGTASSIEVTERVPVVQTTHGWIYARSSEPGEIWPAVYEKAYAKWKTGEQSDQPDFGPIAWGWPVVATTELTNLAGTVHTCADYTADDIWSMVRANSLSMRTVNPMTAWTFCETPSPVEYENSGIFGYHAYTILGWDYVDKQKYVVIRNPWGSNSAVVDSLSGNWSAFDHSFWRNVPLNSAGVFAIPAETFKKYFWQLGWAS